MIEKEPDIAADFVIELNQGALKEYPKVRGAAARHESDVCAGRARAAVELESIVQALGMPMADRR